MVNRVTKDMKLNNDRNSQALHYAAGPELQEGLNMAGGISDNQIIQTDGFNLACESLYHVCLPVWSENSLRVSAVIAVLFYRTGRKFSLEFKFCYFVNGKFTKF